MLKNLKLFPKQCLEGFELGKGVKVKKPKDILVCGMGGSGITGDFLKEMDLDVPVVVNKRQKIPKFVSKDTLVFCVSYSGNTKETISSFKEAKKSGARVVVITSDGKISSLAKEDMIKVPQGLLPRATFGYLFFPILRILQNSGMIDVEREVKKIEKLNVSAVNKEARGLSKKLFKKFPLVYSNSYAVAYRWKTQFNENSKILAMAYPIPEIFHNEVEGYGSKGINPFIVILNINSRIKPNFKKLLKERRMHYKIFNFNKGLDEKIKAMWLGDLTSYHLGVLYKKSPEDTEVIEWLKGNRKSFPK